MGRQAPAGINFMYDNNPSEENLMKKTLSVLTAMAMLLGLALDAGAANRKGSHRVGGTNSHGKGSHYVGGYKR